MPEYDAFGREIGEDTLAGLGGTGTPQPQPQPTPAPAPPSDGFTDASPAPEPAQVTFSIPEGAPAMPLPGPRRRRMGGLGCLIGLVVLAAVVAGPVIAIVGFVGDASDVIDDVTEAIDPDDVEQPPGVVQADPPTGIAGRSLIGGDRLAGALRRVDRAGFTRFTRIIVWPERLTAGVVKGGRERDVQLTYDGGDVARGAARPANAASPTFPLSSIDPAAPARLVRGSAKRYRVKPNGINYLAALPDGSGGHRWIAYFKNGVYIEGDPKGRAVRRIS